MTEAEKAMEIFKTKFQDLDKQNKILLSSKKELEKKAKTAEEKLFRQNEKMEQFKGYSKRLEKYLLKKKVDLNEFLDAEENGKSEPVF